MHHLPPPEAPQIDLQGGDRGMIQPLPVPTVTLRSEAKSS